MIERICSVDGCGKKHKARGLCGRHYQRLRAGLDVVNDARPRKPVEDRLAAHRVVEASGCWRWTGSDNGRGYGAIYIDGERHQAHRVAYEMWLGPIPRGLTLDHLCRNPSCINPAHLEPVTLAENIRRAFSARDWTHCKRGHLRSENDIIRKSGHRVCRACARELQRSRKMRREAA